MSLMTRKFFGLVILLAMVVGLSAPRVHAQINYGSVRGLAKDTQGAVIPDADVTLTNLGTKLVRTAKTNGSGEYDFSSVTPGDYEVTVTLKGFKTAKEATTVDLGATATVDIALQVGASAETVEVKTSEPLIDTASASAGQSFTSQQLTELPNLGRNPFVFEKLDNNVTPVGDPRYVRAEDQSGSTAVSIAGAPIGANSYVVDGIPTSTSSGGVTFIPSPEAVSDAKTQANTYDAEVGRTGGGVGNTSLKSGSSTYHGTLWGETRQTPWSSNSWTNGHTPYIVNGQQVSAFTPKPDVTTYLYAGAVGGPVPFADKFKFTKNSFFYVTEEGYRQAQPLTGSSTLFVPTAAEASGDFTADVTSGGISGLYDPTSPFTGTGSTRSTKLADSRCNGTPTSGCVPSSLLNPIGSWIAGNSYPVQTFAGGFGNPNYSKSDDFKTRSDMYSGKLDHTFAPWWSSNVSYVHLATQEPSGDIYGNKGNFSSDARLVRFNDATALYNVLTVNPTTIVTVGYGFNRYYSVSFPYGLGFNLASGFGGAGFPASFLANDQNHFGSKYTFPSITATNTSSSSTNFASLGGSFGGRSIASATHNLVFGVQKTIGKQNLKAGYVYRSMHVAANPTGALPSFTFNGAFSSADGKSTSGTAVAKSGNGLADLEMGLPDSASIGQSIGAFDERANYHALYIQDDFRANDKLTVNIGVRYEYELGERELNNQLVVGFDRNITYTIPTATVGTISEGGAIAHGGLAYAGQNGYPIHTANQSHTKFSPRVGIAYEPRKGSVLQAGFGVFYAPEAVSAFNTGYSQSSSFTAGTGGNITTPVPTGQVGSGAFLSNPFNGTTNGSIIAPSGNTLGYLTALGGSVSVIDFKRTDPVVEQYSVRLEHQLPWATTLTLGYAGAHSKNFPQSVNINQLPDALMAQFAATSAAGTPVNYSTAAANNPYYLPTVTSPNGVTYNNPSLLSNTTITSGQLLLPYPQYTTVTLSESTGYNLYNAFNVKVQKRAAKGLTVLFAYTWASNWDNLFGGGSSLLGTNGPADNYNLKKEYARAVNDIPNRFTAGLTYAVPVGRGQQFFGGMPKWLDYAVGGYSIDSIITREDGGSFGITQSTNYASTYGVSGFGGTERPNLTGANPCLSGKPGDRTGLNGIQPYYNMAAFSGAQPFTYGNEPRSLRCHGPGLSDTDISVNKTFAIGERVKIKFIAEALNVTNTTEFGFIGSSATTLTSNQNTLQTGATKANSATPVALQTTPTANTTGALAQINYSRFIQLGGRISF